MPQLPARYLVDACLIARMRRLDAAVLDALGPVDAVPSLIVIDELLFGLPEDHPIYEGNVRLLADLGDPIENEPEIFFRARDLLRDYARHHKPLEERDALIAAAALVHDRVLITLNVSDFHFIEGLRYSDANGYALGDAPMSETRDVLVGGISDDPCCEFIRADRRRKSPRSPE